MSVSAMAWAFEAPVETALQRLVLITLCDHANADSGVCWPKVSTIMRRTLLSRRTVFRVLEQLEECGLITRQPVIQGRMKRPSEYLLHCGNPWPKTRADAPGVQQAQAAIDRAKLNKMGGVRQAPPRCQRDTTRGVSVTPYEPEKRTGKGTVVHGPSLREGCASAPANTQGPGNLKASTESQRPKAGGGETSHNGSKPRSRNDQEQGACQENGLGPLGMAFRTMPTEGGVQ